VFATAGSAGGASKRAALKLLQQDPLQSVASVIVYCTFQSQADEIAQYLYSQGISALSYHAGKSFKVQPFLFCSGQDCFAATFAFDRAVACKLHRQISDNFSLQT